MVREIRQIEIGQLHLRYAHTRIERPRESLALAASIERIGQIIPVIVTVTFVLLDGYLRVRALKTCGRDTVHGGDLGLQRRRGPRGDPRPVPQQKMGCPRGGGPP